MKKIIYITLCLVLLSCLAQQKKYKTIDVNNFKEQIFYTEDSTKIDQMIFSEDEYYIYITKKNSLFTSEYRYDGEGKLVKYGDRISNGNTPTNKWYTYENGKVTKVVDYNKDFQFTFDDVQKYAKEQEIDLLKTSIGKNSENGWTLNYKGYYKGEKGYYRGEEGSYIIRLDKTTGEEILVTRKSARLIIRNPVSAGFIYDTVYYKGKYYPPVVYTEETE